MLETEEEEDKHDKVVKSWIIVNCEPVLLFSQLNEIHRRYS